MQEFLQLRKFVAPEFVFGVDGRNMAGRYARNLGANRVFVVSDPGVIAAGWTMPVVAGIESEGLSCVVFSKVTSNPKTDEVMFGAERYKNEGCNFIVAVGGGSPMDCAKGIGIVTSNHAHITSFEGVDLVPAPGPPLLCVPTTAGSSADVSQFAVITDVDRHSKMTIVSKSVVADVSLIDPVTTTTMDAKLTAATGIDALCHAMEAYVSSAQSPITDLHALEAVRLVARHLTSAVARPNDISARGKMMLGSLHAGLAFSNASLGAVHAMAHALGGLMDIPHGQANALLLDLIVEFNFDAAPARYLALAEAMSVRNPEKAALVAELRRLRKAVGLDTGLGAMGLTRANIPALAALALQDPCVVTNPRRPTQEELESLYDTAL